jgi:CubicO group peptidase (beta-lactamase class C family)
MRALAATASLFAAMPAHADALDDVINAEMARQDIPGLSIAIVEGEKVIRVQGYGKASLEHDVAVTPNTVFQMGSIGKQFTAIAILMLEKEGKLSLDDPLLRHFPDAPKAWADIRIKHLLSHVAGIKDNDSLFAIQTNPNAAAIRKQIWKTPRNAKAGTAFAYSNMAYVLLGHIIEQKTGAPYHQFLDTRIFKPLGMTSTQAISDRAIIKGRASGYERVEGKLLNQDWVSPAFNSTADGSSYTTARDFSLWMQAQNAPPAWLAPYLERITKPTPAPGGKQFAYGMGWFLSNVGGVPFHYHTGSWQGFKAITVRYPKTRQSITLFTNSNATERYALLAAVAAKALPGLPAPAESEGLKPVQGGQ